MTAADRPNFWRLRNPIMWACLATVVFTALIIWFGSALTCNEDLFPKGDCPPKWRHLYVAPPNEVGDTLAGLAGVLAFVWLIATVLLQSIELGEQRRVLALQREEMEEQRKATQDMAKSMSAQAKIFEDEQNSRDEAKAKELFDKLLENAADLMVGPSLSIVSWRGPYADDPDSFDYETYHTLFFNPTDWGSDDVPKWIGDDDRESYLKKQFYHVESTLSLDSPNFSDESFEDSLKELSELVTVLSNICALSDQLSSAQKQRLNNLKIAGLRDLLDSFLTKATAAIKDKKDKDVSE